MRSITNDSTKVWSIEYVKDDLLYSMHILGTWQEAQTHCQNLALEEPELVLDIQPYDIFRKFQ